MWPWLLAGGLVTAVILIGRNSLGGAGTPFVVVGKDGVQRVSPFVSEAALRERMDPYHLFGAEPEKLTDASFAIRGRRDMTPIDQALPRLFNKVTELAGDAEVTATFMAIDELVSLMSGDKPVQLTIYVAPRALIAAKASQGSKFVVID